MDGVTCRNCQGANGAGQEHCQYCGFPLPRTAGAADGRRPADPVAVPGPSGAGALDDDPFSPRGVQVTVRATGAGDIVLRPGDRLVVGRTPDSPLAPICGDNISFHHAEIYVAGTGAFVEDTGSTNGTFLDGERLAPRARRALTAPAFLTCATDPPLRLALEIGPLG